MKKLIKALIWILIIGSSGCQNSNNGNHTYRLVSTRWMFSGIQHINTRTFESIPADLRGMDMVFNSSYNFQAKSSCNTAYGYYVTGENNSLKIDSIVLTKIFCMDSAQMVWEDKYITGFKNVKSFEIAHDTLSLRTGKDTEMVFKAETQNK